MATLLARAFGSIISVIASCFFGYRDNKKGFSNINYYNMPKGRPLSLQVPFHPKYILFLSFGPSRYLNCLPSPFTMLLHLQLARKQMEKKKKLGLLHIHGHREANLPTFPSYFMGYIFSVSAFSFSFVRPLWMLKWQCKTLEAFLHKKSYVAC